jgi:putative nucleotidyltransferase with HDIG domain
MFTGPSRLPALFVAATVGVWGAWRESAVTIAAFNCANSVLSTVAGSLVFVRSLSALGGDLHHVSLALLVSGVLASSAYELTNVLLTGVASVVKYGQTLSSFIRDEAPPFLRSLAMLTALGLVVAAIYVRAGIIAVVLLFAPLLAAQYMFKLLVRERQAVQRQKELSEGYLEMNIGLAAAMVVLLDSKDEYTASHSAAVAMYCRDMAKALGLPEDDIEALHLAGLLHDLGKVGTPDAVLRKESTLEPDEWAYVHQHPGKGAEVLSHLVAYQDVADIVQFHHERLDGSGYPDGVLGDEIPELSKILAVADSYDAMTSDRPYRPARSSFEALKELRRMSGVTLDSRYVEVLATILRDKDLAYRDGTSTDFMEEYRLGRINLRLRGSALADAIGTAEKKRGPAVS